MATTRPTAALAQIEVDVVDRRYAGADGFAVLLARRVDDGHALTLAGAGGLARFARGDRLSVVGRFEAHPTHGKRFVVEGAAPKVNPTPDGIVRYLEKAGLPGVGRARAHALVEAFGDQALSALAGRHTTARAIIGETADEVFAAYERGAARAELDALLIAAGLKAPTREAIWEAYGTAAATIVVGNPYRLPADIPGVSFAAADRLADVTGFAGDAHARAKAGVIEVARLAAERVGHTGLPRGVLVREAARLLRTSAEAVETAIGAMLETGQLMTGQWRDREIVQLRYLAVAETTIAEAIRAKLAQPKLQGDIEGAIRAAEAATGLALDDSQLAAARLALTEPLSVIDGPPGTGKSTVLAVVLEALNLLQPGARVGLAAPVGKAAERLEEVTGRAAATLHRLLDYADGVFRRHARSPLELDLIVVDEMSLTDTPLAARLAEAWGQARVILQGDAHQLASVGPGRVLADLIASNALPHARLSEVWRAGKNVDIPLAVQAIVRGESPPEHPAGASPFVTRFLDSAKATAAEAVRLAVEALPRHLGTTEPVMVLSPAHSGPAGITALNLAIQRARFENTARPLVKVAGGLSAGVGDRVIILDNCRTRKVYNGHMGRVIAADPDKRRLEVKLKDGRRVVYAGGETAGLALAYALSVHRFQGSEAAACITVLTMSHRIMLSRELLATSVSRAKSLSVLVGERKARDAAIEVSELERRITGLAARLVADPLGHLPVGARRESEMVTARKQEKTDLRAAGILDRLALPV